MMKSASDLGDELLLSKLNATWMFSSIIFNIVLDDNAYVIFWSILGQALVDAGECMKQISEAKDALVNPIFNY